MKKRFVTWLCLGLVWFLSSNYVLSPKKALSFPTALYSIKGEQVLLPDWQQIAFSQFPPIAKNGSFLINGIKRVWQQGQTPDQYLNLIDIKELSPELASLEYIFNNTGLSLANFSLDRFPLVGEQTIGQLVNIIPNLGITSVLTVPPIANLIGSTCSSGLSGTINQALGSCGGQLSNMLLNSINLSAFPLDSIPYLDLVPLGSFNNWSGQLISQIPGLSSLPLSLFPNPISPGGNLVARIDAVWGSAEAQRMRSVSGGYRVGFSVPCQGGNCAHVELDDLEQQGMSVRRPFEGRSWIWGQQKVRGGSGCLSGKEPTGRHPWGRIFKVVVEDIDETTDLVETALYFRSCTICGCTPYVIGPVPFINYPVNSLIFLGDASQDTLANFEELPVDVASHQSIKIAHSSFDLDPQKLAWEGADSQKISSFFQSDRPWRQALPAHAAPLLRSDQRRYDYVERTAPLLRSDRDKGRLLGKNMSDYGKNVALQYQSQNTK